MQKRKYEPIKTTYYKDELNDEFAGDHIVPKEITEEYDYLPKRFTWKLNRFLIYRVIMKPIAYLYSKIALGQKVVNKKVLKSVKGKGYFLYINHTHPVGDAFMPNAAQYTKSIYMITHPNNVSMPFLGRLTPYMGAIPTPTKIRATRKFKNAVEKRILEGSCVVIYPEAHIWPYYTDIRPFRDISMVYPSELEEPSFTMTNTYQRSKFRKKPKVVSYIDGPFYPDMSLDKHARTKELRDRIYETMKERSKNSNYIYIKYEKEKDSD